ncbi:MAG: FAD-binding oxidoreductase [Cyclobacteriaceae bacterium]
MKEITKEEKLFGVYSEIISICGESLVELPSRQNKFYGKDETMNKEYSFDILVKPRTTQQIADIMKVCNRCKVGITIRGGGTGVTGGALPVDGGVVLSMEKLNQIIKVDKLDRIAILEAGVIAENFYNELEKFNLFFPIQPGSSGSCQIGGNVSENSGSINSCKYGVMSDYVLNLEVVLASGEIIWTGTNVRKDTAGLNLTQLFAGSEGILGVITKVVLRLINKPRKEIHLLAGFKSIKNAIMFCQALNQTDIEPSAVELLDKASIEMCEQHFGYAMFPKEANQAHLIIKLEGQSEDHIFSLLERIQTLSQELVEEPMLIGQSEEEIKKIWTFRKGMGQILKTGGRTYRDIDATVRLSKIKDYVDLIDGLAKKHTAEIVKFGHILDGNLHTMLIFNKEDDSHQYDKVVEEIYTGVKKLGGTITGEHGIGFIQKEYLKNQIGETNYIILKEIKAILDPNDILNPKKVIL